MPQGVQAQVNVVPAIAIAGDFCDHNPRTSVDAGPGGLVAGASGVTVGRFAWLLYSLVDPENAAILANNFGLGPVAGFVGRHQQALNTTYLSTSGVLIPSGFPLTLYNQGGFWVKNEGSTYAQPGQKCYAAFANGAASFGVTGSPPQAFSHTASIAASTFSVTGTITGNVLTAVSGLTGTIVPGGTISGTGVATGTKIVSQLSGTAGGLGTYAVSIGSQAVASTSISGTYGTMTSTAATTGLVGIGDVLAGSGVVAGTTVTALGTGTGGTGTYIVDNNTVVSSTTITGTAAVETKWVAMSGGAAGELVKISSWLLG